MFVSSVLQVKFGDGLNNKKKRIEEGKTKREKLQQQQQKCDIKLGEWKDKQKKFQAKSTLEKKLHELLVWKANDVNVMENYHAIVH